MNQKICLSMTKYHPEAWSPVWTGIYLADLVRKMLEAIQAFMPIDERGVGALSYSSEDRKNIAKNTRNYQCPVCNQKLKDHEQVILENRKFIEEKEKFEKRERIQSEDNARKLAAQEEEDTKQYFIKKSIDQSNLLEYQQGDETDITGHFGVSPRGVFGAGPNIPCHKGGLKQEIEPPRVEIPNLPMTKKPEDCTEDKYSRSKPSPMAFRKDSRFNLEDKPARQYCGETLQEMRPEFSPERPASKLSLRCMDDVGFNNDESANELAKVRERNRQLIDGFLGKKDVASLEDILNTQLLEGKIRADNIMENQYRSFVDKINSVTFTHKDQVYDSLASLLKEAMELQSISRTVEFHENEALAEERDRKHRETVLRGRERTEEMQEGGDVEVDPAIEEEERIKQSIEYKTLQKRLKLFDLMTFGLVFAAIGYFSWDILAFIIFGN